MCLHVYNQESFLIWQVFSLCLHDYMSTIIKLPSLPLGLWLCIYMYANKKIPLSGRFSVCVYNQKVPFSCRFSVCVNLLTIEDFVSFVHIEFVSKGLHFYNQKSFLLWQILSLFLLTCLQQKSSLLWLIFISNSEKWSNARACTNTSTYTYMYLGYFSL